jgi:predicted transcriptional regulator
VAEKKELSLTRFEMEVMQALWGLGRASVREVQEHLPEKKQVAYTTVQTIVRRLEEKGVLRRVRKIGNAFIFEPLITRSAAQRGLITQLLDLFGGSVRPMMSHLVEVGKLRVEDLQEIEVMLAAKQAGKHEEHRD